MSVWTDAHSRFFGENMERNGHLCKWDMYSQKVVSVLQASLTYSEWLIGSLPLLLGSYGNSLRCGGFATSGLVSPVASLCDASDQQSSAGFDVTRLCINYCAYWSLIVLYLYNVMDFLWGIYVLSGNELPTFREAWIQLFCFILKIGRMVFIAIM